MTPKEKAEELVDKFYQLFPLQSEVITSIGELTWEYDNWKQAKQCALIAVDEILNLVCCMDGKEHWQEYYEKVKIEIENL